MAHAAQSTCRDPLHLNAAPGCVHFDSAGGDLPLGVHQLIATGGIPDRGAASHCWAAQAAGPITVGVKVQPGTCGAGTAHAWSSLPGCHSCSWTLTGPSDAGVGQRWEQLQAARGSPLRLGHRQPPGTGAFVAAAPAHDNSEHCRSCCPPQRPEQHHWACMPATVPLRGASDQQLSVRHAAVCLAALLGTWYSYRHGELILCSAALLPVTHVEGCCWPHAALLISPIHKPLQSI